MKAYCLTGKEEMDPAGRRCPPPRLENNTIRGTWISLGRHGCVGPRRGERMKKIARRRVALVAVVAGCTAAVAGAVTNGTGTASSASKQSFTVGTKGRVVHLTQRQAHRLSG